VPHVLHVRHKKICYFTSRTLVLDTTDSFWSFGNYTRESLVCWELLLEYINLKLFGNGYSMQLHTEKIGRKDSSKTKDFYITCVCFISRLNIHIYIVYEMYIFFFNNNMSVKFYLFFHSELVFER